jgi:hypothetical protein
VVKTAVSREYDIFCHGRINLLASIFKVGLDVSLDSFERKGGATVLPLAADETRLTPVQPSLPALLGSP